VLHQKHAEWSPERIVSWAKSIDENTAMLVEKILTERKHPEHGYRLLARLAKTDVLIIDDWALTPLSADQRNDIFEFLEDRYGGPLDHLRQPARPEALSRVPRRPP